MAPFDDIPFSLHQSDNNDEDGLTSALAAAANHPDSALDTSTALGGAFSSSSTNLFGGIGGEGIFMSAKSMAGDNDVFARLAALTSPDPNSENMGPGMASRSRIRTRGEGDDEEDTGSGGALGKAFGLHLGYATPSVGGSGISTMTSSVPPSSPGSPGKRPRKRARLDVGDRFVPTREIDERQRAFHLLDDDERVTRRIIPHESDAAREQANVTFSSMLSRELADEDSPTLSSRPVTPARTTSSLAGPSTLPSSAASTAGSSTSALPTTPTRKQRVFQFQTPPRSSTPLPLPLGHDTPLASAYATSPIKPSTSSFLTSPQRQLRSVCKTPFRVLDAPELTDDFYLNLVDWSSTNVLGVGLGSAVYLWSAKTAQVTKLCDLQERHDAITSLCWVQRGSVLAVGTFHGGVEIWDAVKNVRIRRYDGHVQRVGALAWNESTVSSGSRDRKICNWDVREKGKKAYSTLLGHRQEVCGLKWGGGVGVRQLASGGNDNKLMIWDARGSGVGANGGNAHPSSTTTGVSVAGGGVDAGTGVVPVWKWHEHSAAVKAIAWNPHIPGVLVSGGGTQDKKMRFWNTMVGSMLAEVDTGSQVCNLIWSKTSQELVSTHGYSTPNEKNLICIWKYPSMDMVATLSGHSNRVLYLAMSPDGQTIVTGAGDETLRFWNAFPRKREGREGKGVAGWGTTIR